MRVGIIRELKLEYGDNFDGGLFSSPFAKSIAPDLILSDKKTNKENYLRVMKSADICIGSTGLHDSIGWKTAEYIASSKAIVAEKFCYEVSGNWKEGINYLPFSTIDECVDAVRFLVLHPWKICEMQESNYKFYNESLQPARLVEHTLSYI